MSESKFYSANCTCLFLHVITVICITWGLSHTSAQITSQEIIFPAESNNKKVWQDLVRFRILMDCEGKWRTVCLKPVGCSSEMQIFKFVVKSRKGRMRQIIACSTVFVINPKANTSILIWWTGPKVNGGKFNHSKCIAGERLTAMPF